MRGYATQIMVYLAVHADGATPEQMLEDIWPGERPRVTAIRLHTGVSNLRKLLGASIGAGPGGLVVKQHGRYRMDPDAVEVDLWDLRAAHAAARANAGTDPAARLDALRLACAAYTGPLADGMEYEWAEPHRRGALNLALDAHLALATAVQDGAPADAARLLDAAIRHDPVNEHLYQQAMRAYRRLGDPDTVLALLRQLTLALSAVDATPSAETVDLCEQLRREMSDQARPGA
jgi:DNA-binding SARP family transcriptional activator